MMTAIGWPFLAMVMDDSLPDSSRRSSLEKLVFASNTFICIRGPSSHLVSRPGRPSGQIIDQDNKKSKCLGFDSAGFFVARESLL
jgi:hypothetical protein